MSLYREQGLSRSQNLRKKIRHTLQKLCPDWWGLFPCYAPVENIFSPHIVVQKYNNEQDQCCLVYYSQHETPLTVYIDTVAIPFVAYKISTLPSDARHAGASQSTSRPLRHHAWIDLQGKQGLLRAQMQGQECILQLDHETYNALPCVTLRQAYTQPSVPFYAHKYAQAWILMDRAHVADDNAEHLYRYIQKHHPEQPIYFALQKNCPDWLRLQAENFDLVDIDSLKFRVLLQYCQLIASSHMDIFLLENTWAHSHKSRKKHVLLQHGVIYNDLSGWLNSPEVSFDLLTCTTHAEYAAIVGEKSPYFYSTKEAQLLGLTRHDALLPSLQKHASTLLIMPTWRRYLSECTDIAQLRASTYVQQWQALLHDKAFQDVAQRHGLNIVFYLHNDSQNIREVLDIPPHVHFAEQGTNSIQEYFKDAAMMITDYSSVFFEMAFLEKPLIYYQFDSEDFYGNHWKRGYFSFEEHSFGPIAHTQEELLQHMEHALQHTQELEPYISRMRTSFAHKDGQNCARTYEALTHLFHPLATPASQA